MKVRKVFKKVIRFLKKNRTETWFLIHALIEIVNNNLNVY